MLHPPAPNLGGEKVFFDIREISHNASNFLYIKKMLRRDPELFLMQNKNEFIGMSLLCL